MNDWTEERSHINCEALCVAFRVSILVARLMPHRLKQHNTRLQVLAGTLGISQCTITTFQVLRKKVARFS